MNVVEDARNESLGQARGRRWRRLSMVELLAALALLFFSAPFVEGLKAGPLIESALFSVVLLSGVLAVADRRRTLAIAFALAVPAVALRWMHHLWPDAIPIVAFLVIGL